MRNKLPGALDSLAGCFGPRTDWHNMTTRTALQQLPARLMRMDAGEGALSVQCDVSLA